MQQNVLYTKFLVDAGCNVNAKEGCGLTPLSLAVLKKNEELVRFLVLSGAKWNGPLFTSIPSPKEMAMAIQCPSIVEIFERDGYDSEEEDQAIKSIDVSYNLERSEVSK
eukprot:Seg185.2 transcript_id=Seg185.2/GoldUCD/mRNA.D3Y31 product="Fibronectin type 3 and ankyrin repeat domains protein 1" protein_id=Seg185.2/GoldUCD/D3Y31